MKPPINGPTIELTPQTPLNRPWIRARCSTENMSPTMMKARASNPPAPRPCAARNKTRSSMLVAVPHSNDPSKKIAIAVRYTRRRPNTSESLP